MKRGSEDGESKEAHGFDVCGVVWWRFVVSSLLVVCCCTLLLWYVGVHVGVYGRSSGARSWSGVA